MGRAVFTGSFADPPSPVIRTLASDQAAHPIRLRPHESDRPSRFNADCGCAHVHMRRVLTKGDPVVQSSARPEIEAFFPTLPANPVSIHRFPQIARGSQTLALNERPLSEDCRHAFQCSPFPLQIRPKEAPRS